MTLNQVVSRIRGIVTSHGQLKSFYLGDPWELEHQQAGAVEYACVLCQLVNLTLGVGYTQFNFSLYIMDQVAVEETGELDTLSDMVLVAQDIMAGLRNDIYQDWVLSDTNSGPFFTERMETSVAGVRVDIAIQVDNEGDRCAVPEN